jgi:hypothetical protein
MRARSAVTASSENATRVARTFANSDSIASVAEAGDPDALRAAARRLGERLRADGHDQPIFDRRARA